MLNSLANITYNAKTRKNQTDCYVCIKRKKFVVLPRHAVYAVGNRRKLSEFGNFFRCPDSPAVCQQYIAKQQKFLGNRSFAFLRYSVYNFYCVKVVLSSNFCIIFIQNSFYKTRHNLYCRMLQNYHVSRRKPAYLEEQISRCKQQLRSGVISAISLNFCRPCNS